MKRTRSSIAFAALMPLLLGLSGAKVNAQPLPPPDDPMFDGGPLFDDAEQGHRPRGGEFGGRGGPRGGGPKGRLDGVWHGVERLKSGANALSKSQSQKIAALVKPWSNRPTMSDAEAQKLALNIEAVLTSAQKSNFGPPRFGSHQGGPPPRNGDDGPPPPPPRDDEDGPPPPPPDGDFGPPPPPHGKGNDGPPPGRRRGGNIP